MIEWNTGTVILVIFGSLAGLIILSSAIIFVLTYIFKRKANNKVKEEKEQASTKLTKEDIQLELKKREIQKMLEEIQRKQNKL